MHALIKPAASGPARTVPTLPPAVMDTVRHVLTWEDGRAMRAAAAPAERDTMHTGARPSVPIPTEAEQRWAGGALAATSAAMEPATLADWDAFLRPVAAACRNPPSRDDFEVKKIAIATFCADMPRGALTAGTLRRLKPGFFSAPAEIAAACEPEVRRLRAEAEVLGKMTNGPTTAHPLYTAVAGRVKPEEFRRWFGPLGILRRDEERRPLPNGGAKTVLTFILSAPTRFHADHVQREYGHVLAQGLGGRVDFEVAATGAH